MKKITLTLATILFVSQFSLAIAADPSIRQMQPRPMTPQRGSTIPQLQLTPDYLYQQITALQQQVANLQGQVNLLRSVVQISQNGTTITAENLSFNAGKTLTMSSGAGTNVSVGENLTFISAKNISIKGGLDVTAEGARTVKLKAPQIKLNDGTKLLAVVGSPVSGGKVISGSTSVFAQ
ncbi:MAG: hypothetical protein E4H32_05900 [Nitrospirales bacterium]|nr:MAG: hypothetical protein E4H32_05900 [Nitrospirales bacterium]